MFDTLRLAQQEAQIPYNVIEFTYKSERTHLTGTSNTSVMAHEDLSREQHIEGSTERSFGLVFAAVFAIVGCWPLLYGEVPRWWSLGIAGACAMVALLRPSLLAVPNRFWIKLGVILGKVISPIALGIVFYAVLMPIGAMLRITGKDPLRLKLDRNAGSYWILRKPPGPPPDSMTHPF